MRDRETDRERERERKKKKQRLRDPLNKLFWAIKIKKTSLLLKKNTKTEKKMPC
jgi:hypothetical protein